MARKPVSALAARLRELAERATPGPWFLFSSNRTLQLSDSDAHDNKSTVVHWMGFDAGDKPLKIKRANARLIRELRNNLPAILSALDGREAAIRECAAVCGRLMEANQHSAYRGARLCHEAILSLAAKGAG